MIEKETKMTNLHKGMRIVVIVVLGVVLLGSGAACGFSVKYYLAYRQAAHQASTHVPVSGERPVEGGDVG